MLDCLAHRDRPITRFFSTRPAWDPISCKQQPTVWPIYTRERRAQSQLLHPHSELTIFMPELQLMARVTSFAHHVAARARMHVGDDDSMSETSSNCACSHDCDFLLLRSCIAPEAEDAQRAAKLQFAQSRLKGVHENIRSVRVCAHSERMPADAIIAVHVLHVAVSIKQTPDC